jgi:hypothetical protein
MAGHLEAHEHARIVVLDDPDVDRADTRFVLEQRRLRLIPAHVRCPGQRLVDIREIRQPVIRQVLERACFCDPRST